MKPVKVTVEPPDDPTMEFWVNAYDFQIDVKQEMLDITTARDQYKQWMGGKRHLSIEGTLTEAPTTSRTLNRKALIL